MRDWIEPPERAAALIDALPEAERAHWALAFNAGLRRGELQALRCSDLDLAANAINVRRSWDPYAGEIEPKSRAGRRKVPLSGELRPDRRRAHAEDRPPRR